MRVVTFKTSLINCEKAFNISLPCILCFVICNCELDIKNKSIGPPEAVLVTYSIYV